MSAKDWRDHVLLLDPPGGGAILWARLQARKVPLRDWDTRQSDSEYLWRVARMDDRWAYGSNHVAQNYGTRAAPDSSLVPVPFRAPHHTVSERGMTGAIARGWQIRPGELSLAHGGVLLLDEVNEFRISVLTAVLEAVRRGHQVLPIGNGATLKVPTEFRLIATMRPCPCGWRGVERSMCRSMCRCSDLAIERWMAGAKQVRAVCRELPTSEWRAELEAGKAELT